MFAPEAPLPTCECTCTVLESCTTTVCTHSGRLVRNKHAQLFQRLNRKFHMSINPSMAKECNAFISWKNADPGLRVMGVSYSCSPVHLRATQEQKNHSRLQTIWSFQLTSQHVFRLWEDGGEPGGNLCRCREYSISTSFYIYIYLLFYISQC